MNKKDKDLLLKDLCARLPYGVKIQDYQKLGEFALLTQVDFHRKQIAVETGIGSFEGIAFYKLEWSLPYLRPMSSMTEEEVYKFIQISDSVLRIGEKKSTCILSLEQIDWLNAHHFDYRGLIPMGLALEATEGMYTF